MVYMEMKPTFDSKMRRLIGKYKFSTRIAALRAVNKAERAIRRHGSLSFIDLICVLEGSTHDLIYDKYYFESNVYSHMEKYGWTTTSDWIVSCVHPNDGEKKYWKINTGLPVRIESKYYRYPYLMEGDRVHVREYGINDESASSGTKYSAVMTFNSNANTGRHYPDYCEFVREYPDYVVVRCHFESNGGESYCDCIPNWAIRSGKVKIALEEDD